MLMVNVSPRFALRDTIRCSGGVIRLAMNIGHLLTPRVTESLTHGTISFCFKNPLSL